MGYRILFLILIVQVTTVSKGQNSIWSKFSNRVVTTQFAGSIGFYSGGFSLVTTTKNKFEAGLLYGHVPRSMGGVNRSITLKGTYNPFQFRCTKVISIEPLQTGIFICQNFNQHLSLSWGNNYPPGYYWWTKSLRFHIFLGAKVSLIQNRKRLDRISFFFEANTNDLYLLSYFPNMKSMSLYDIVFFGAGIKVYYRKKHQRHQ